jgi:hypothetical protein
MICYSEDVAHFLKNLMSISTLWYLHKFFVIVCGDREGLFITETFYIEYIKLRN